MPSILSILSSAPAGINSTAARSRAVLNEPRRKLPETPIIVVIPRLPELLQHRGRYRSHYRPQSRRDPPYLASDSKVLTINLSRGQKTRARLGSLVESILPPGRLPLSKVADVQCSFASNSPDSQISGNCKVVLAFDLHLVALEGDLRMVLHIKKVCAAQMVVAFLH